MDEVKTGNFNQDVLKTGDWVVGFGEQSALRNNDLGIKWSKYKKGDTKPQATANKKAKTIGFLISGKIEIMLTELDRSVLLEKEGDYIYLPPNTKHYHKALEDSLLISVRWPAIDDQY